jgi:two-component system response regulator LytT
MKNILIIEDDAKWQRNLDKILVQFNYRNLHFCRDILEANLFLKKQTPALIIADILIDKNYISDLLKNEHSAKIPILFITTSSNIELYNMAKLFPRAMYLVKPFHQISIKAAIDNLIEEEQKPVANNLYGITVRVIYNEKIFLGVDQIVYVKSESNYSIIKTPKNQFALKINLIKLMLALGPHMIRIHRSYIINTTYIQKVNLSQMTIKLKIEPENVILPIGRSNKSHVEEYLNLIREI